MSSRTKKMRVLLSAYSCEPDKGSEPAVGWGLATNLSKKHEVWVLTRSNNQPSIEKALSTNAFPDLHFVYFDLPGLFLWLKRKTGCVRIYYYLWQLASIPLTRLLHRKLGFQVCQHVTMVKYWAPSNLLATPVPFLWGPVGGGESLPPVLRSSLSLRSRMEERIRTIGRRLGEMDPFVHITARKAAMGLATTPETASRMHQLHVKKVSCLPQIALEIDEIDELTPENRCPKSQPIRFLCIGRLVGWKGFHLALRGFMQMNLPDTELWIVGDGPERRSLEHWATSFANPERVRFTGRLPRKEVLAVLQRGHVLVHPSLHDSGGLVCLEAMAAGNPVICLNTGGPAGLVDENTGVRIPVQPLEHITQSISDAMRRYVTDPSLRESHSLRASQHVREHHQWRNRCRILTDFYETLVTPCES